MLPSPRQIRKTLEALSPAERGRVIESLPDDMVLSLRHDWGFLARDAQLPPEDPEWITWLILAGRGFGKALALDTPIPTPSGWTTMGELRVGDSVFDENGVPCRVTFATNVMHGHVCYDVVFDDGTVITADAEHQWLTTTRSRCRANCFNPLVCTTEEILFTLKDEFGAPNHWVESAKTPRRFIVDVRARESVPVRCIQVDSPSHLFLASKSFVPTHNTRTGAEWINEQAREGGQGYRIALVGASAADVRDTMIEGESGIIACARPGMVPTYIPSKRRVIWPNGAMATTFSAETPRQLRGPQHHAAWADELCAWRREETLDQLQFTLRLGQKPRVVITTTPRPTAQLKELIASPTTRVSRGKTDENKANLAPSYLTKVVSKYEGTRLGRQELNAEILDDTPGALWTLTQLETLRVKRPPEFKRIIVAVDPTTSEDGKNDEAGIIAVGISEQNVAYVLEDRSGQYSPEEWARVAVELYTDLEADCIVAESNQGGAMVKLILNSACNEDGSKLRSVPVRLVHASRGKRARAEPVAALYEQGRVRHVGVHAKLENEMTTWSAMQGEPSPNRVDALVWGLTELCLSGPHEKPSAKGARRFAGIAPSPRSF